MIDVANREIVSAPSSLEASDISSIASVTASEAVFKCVGFEVSEIMTSGVSTSSSSSCASFFGEPEASMF